MSNLRLDIVIHLTCYSCEGEGVTSASEVGGGMSESHWSTQYEHTQASKPAALEASVATLATQMAGLVGEPGIFQTSIDSFQVALANVQNTLGDVQNDVNILQASMARMHFMNAVTRNMFSVRFDDPLEPVPHPATGVIPQNFPASVRVLDGMSGAACGVLLSFYDQPLQGLTADGKKSSFAKFIGCTALQP